ncbi:metal-dependent hydrolase [Cytobacillus sp. IB215316]|uniref:metal-dependent hydrolase n=1 Tax=Cytobacillus sp. IB215316 TaxID=3097354 RepID=UPI002A0B25E0|nr:metal-dependent hydrolase [Cytobacillus sp. IB215316]MDX8361587.1 metal-dependent hydrolase [Cytobacillus sp. IB215316]
MNISTLMNVTDVFLLISEIGYHGAIGSFIAYLICRKKELSRRKMMTLLLFGFIAGLTPDLTLLTSIFFSIIPTEVNYANNLYMLGHSILVAPSLSLGLAIIARRFFRSELTLGLLWITMLSSLVIGHLLMDFLDNGLSLFYPINESADIGLNIFTGNDGFIVYPFILLVLLVFLFHNKTNKKYQVTLLIIGISLFISFASLKGFSKIQIQEELLKEYPYAEVTLEPVSGNPFSKTQWNYVVNAENLNVEGEASFFEVNELKRNVNTHSGLKHLLQKMNINNDEYYITTNYIFDNSVNIDLLEENIQYEYVYVFKLNPKTQNLEELVDEEKDEILDTYYPF